MQFILRSALFGLLIASIGAPSTAALAADGDGAADAALSEFRAEREQRAAVENRFFLKKERFEISPVFGYVPNNPFARRYVGGAVIGYHIDEILAASVSIGYAPDGSEGDLNPRPCASRRARNAQTGAGNSDAFNSVGQDRAVLLYERLMGADLRQINLVGETVLNFDFYTFVGVGMVSKQNFVATYGERERGCWRGLRSTSGRRQRGTTRSRHRYRTKLLPQPNHGAQTGCARVLQVDDVPNYDASAATASACTTTHASAGWPSSSEDAASSVRV